MTRELLAAVNDIAGPVHIDPRPQETPWTTPLDEDYEHATYDSAQVSDYLAAATQAALVLAAVRAPYRGRSSPVNAWWGSFDLAVSLFSGRPVEPPSNDFIMRNSGNAQQIEIGWWPGDARHPRRRVLRVRVPRARRLRTSDAFDAGRASWDADLGEYLLDWEEVRRSPEPRNTALDFCLEVVRHACSVCGWDPALAASAEGDPPPVT